MSYLLQTRSSFYSFLFTIPLFFIYEIGILFLSKDDILVVRNGADFLMRSILESFGIFGLYGLGAIFLVGFIVTYIFFLKEKNNNNIRADYLFIMIFESVCWALVLYFLLSKFMLVLMNPIGKTITQKVTLAVGAGIYEEFLFRVVDFGVNWNNWVCVFMEGKSQKNSSVNYCSRDIFRFSFRG